MTTPFTTADLPGGAYAIATVEELVTWGNAVLAFNNAVDQYQEAANTNKLFHFIQPQLRIPSGELVIVNRAAVIVDETTAQNLPTWKRVTGLPGSTVIPAGFKIT